MTVVKLIDKVGDLLREAAAAAILPRFRALAADQIIEKSPGELVTVADREAEAIITNGLTALLPGSLVIGEEACAANPHCLSRISNKRVWLVDPLDGTANFAAGRSTFAVMVALLERGQTVAGWLLDPVTGRLAVAEAGSGAWIAGERVRTSVDVPMVLHGAVGKFMSQAVSEAIHGRSDGLAELTPSLGCAGAEYPLVATSGPHFAIYRRTLAWDHAPGALFLTEAGGKVARWDGSPYRPSEDGEGMLIARNPDIWAKVQERLLA